MSTEGDRTTRAPPSPPPGTELVVIGANHRTASLEEREGFLRRATYAHLRRAPSPPPWMDLVLLTTCNRIEAYVVTATPPEAVRAICEALRVPESASTLYVLRGTEAAAHLLRVAAGLDSLAQGEAQITVQVRKAAASRPASFQRSRILADLLGQAAREAPRIRRLAGLEGKDISASHAALRFIEASAPLTHPTIALLGTGKMARMAAGSLRGRATILVANRDAARAREVAKGLGGRGYGLDHLDQILEAADVVLAATASRRRLVSRARVRRVLARRSGRPLRFIDLGFPRNIDPACGELPGVTLVDIDALAPWGARPLPPEGQARAEARIRVQAERLVNALRPESATDIAALRKAVEAIRRREVDEALARLPGLSDADRAVVDKLAARLVNRFLHGPTERLRELPADARSEVVVELLRSIGGAPR